MLNAWPPNELVKTCCSWPRLKPLDDEMRERIAKHQAARPQGWRTLEAPSLVGAPLVQAAAGREWCW
jgi:adenosyl cobinamide kinase/adenosyl cobinamide phosphate guanylyltransferase